MRRTQGASVEFRRLVNARGAELRLLSRDKLLAVRAQPVDDVRILGRAATLGVIVEEWPDGSLRVVVQGFMPCRLLPFVRDVALDGFYKRPDGSVEPMPDEEFRGFD
jgi:hypothetical protein